MANSNLQTQLKLNKIKTFFYKPQNVILLLCGIVLSVTTIAPILYLIQDTVAVHAGTVDSLKTGLKEGQMTFYNWIDLFTGRLAKANLWTPLLNTVLLSVFVSAFSQTSLSDDWYYNKPIKLIHFQNLKTVKL